MNNVQKQYSQLREELLQKLRLEIDGEFVDLYHGESTLDGSFSQKELRMIADAMDELDRQFLFEE